MLLDEMMATYDVTIAEHQIVQTSTARTYAAAHDLDFLRVHSPLLDAAMWARGVPGRVLGRATLPPPRLVIGEGDPLPGWLLLGDRPGEELAFGAVGRFWQPAIEWRDVPREQFATFAEPAWGRIACNFSVRAYGATSSLLSYECRTSTTDDDARRAFARYWLVIRPFVAHIMRATVRTIRDDAER